MKLGQAEIGSDIAQSFIWPMGSHIWSLFAQIETKVLFGAFLRLSVFVGEGLWVGGVVRRGGLVGLWGVVLCGGLMGWVCGIDLWVVVRNNKQCP